MVTGYKIMTSWALFSRLILVLYLKNNNNSGFFVCLKVIGVWLEGRRASACSKTTLCDMVTAVIKDLWHLTQCHQWKAPIYWGIEGFCAINNVGGIRGCDLDLHFDIKQEIELVKLKKCNAKDKKVHGQEYCWNSSKCTAVFFIIYWTDSLTH